MKKRSIVYCSTIEVTSACGIHSACIYLNRVENTLSKSKFDRQKRRVRMTKDLGEREGRKKADKI